MRKRILVLLCAFSCVEVSFAQFTAPKPDASPMARVSDSFEATLTFFTSAITRVKSGLMNPGMRDDAIAQLKIVHSNLWDIRKLNSDLIIALQSNDEDAKRSSIEQLSSKISELRSQLSRVSTLVPDVDSSLATKAVNEMGDSLGAKNEILWQIANDPETKSQANIDAAHRADTIATNVDNKVAELITLLANQKT